MSNVYPLKRADDNLDGLDQLSALYKDTKAGVKPPHELDTQIRAAAREALKPRKPINLHWAGGFALAATLALGIGLVTLVQREIPEPVSDAGVAPSPGVASEPAKSIEPESAGRSLAPAAQPARLQTTQTREISGKAQAPLAPAANQALINPAAEKLATEAAADQPIREAKAWLEGIIELQKTGDEAEFEKQLMAFKKAYPDYPLPQSLSDR